jgi:large subunit ribosomal protein L35
MPKQKPHKGLRKRVKVSARGKIVRKRPNKSHLNSHKSGKRLRRLRRTRVLTGKLAKNLLEALGEN